MTLVMLNAQGRSVLGETLNVSAADQEVKLSNGTTLWEMGESWWDRRGNRFVCVWGMPEGERDMEELSLVKARSSYGEV